MTHERCFSAPPAPCPGPLGKVSLLLPLVKIPHVDLTVYVVWGLAALSKTRSETNQLFSIKAPGNNHWREIKIRGKNRRNMYSSGENELCGRDKFLEGKFKRIKASMAKRFTYSQIMNVFLSLTRTRDHLSRHPSMKIWVSLNLQRTYYQSKKERMYLELSICLG